MKDLAATILEALMMVFAYKVVRHMTYGSSLKPGKFTWIAVPLVWMPTGLQLLWHSVYTSLNRQPDLFVHHFQWWRVVTPIFVQDGGWPGIVFNLVTILLIAMLADKVWGWQKALVIFMGGGILFNVTGMLLGSIGGGNSGATFILAMSMVGAYLRLNKPTGMRLPALAAVATGLALTAMLNAHGYAILFGTAIGLLFAHQTKEITPNGSDTTHRA